MTQIQVEYVRNTTAFPWRAVVQVQVEWNDGSSSRGSGAVVGPNDVLTSAHVVFAPERGGARRIEVIPGRDGFDRPYGVFTARRWDFFRVDEDGNGLLSDADVARDAALLTVESPRPIGDVTGYFGLRTPGLRDGQRVNLNSAGYPSAYDSDGPRMVRTYDDELFDDGLLRHEIGRQTGRDWGGHSGAPYWMFDDGSRYVVGIHSTGSEATYLNPRLYGHIVDWISANDGGGGGGGGGSGGGGSGGGGGGGGGPRDLRRVGDGGADRLTGKAGDDVLKGRGGNDLLKGRGGDDKLLGGGGRDKALGAAGDDRIEGGGGRDRLVGGDGEDRIRGGKGPDILEGGDGADVLTGQGGKDKLRGGDGVDVLRGGGGRDKLFGEDGNDVLQGRAGRDRLDGGRGDDILVGGGGPDVFVFDRRTTAFGASTRDDEIRDFRPGVDTIVLRGFATFSVSTIAEEASFRDPRTGRFEPGTELTLPGFGGAEIDLPGVLPSELSDSDLIYT